MKRVVEVVVGALVVMAAVFSVAVAVNTRDEFTAMRSENAALREQVYDLGAEPVVPPTGDVVAERGPAGPPGENGKDGADGLTVMGPAGKDALPAENGADGKDGKDGADGKDSTVPGPQGPPGEPGQQGPPGADAKPVTAIVLVSNGVRYTCADPDGDGIYGNPCTTEVVP